MADEMVDIQFPVGKVIGRWVIMEMLGAGGCGAVYKVHDVKRKSLIAAMKVESSADSEGVLKLEIALLKKLKDSSCVLKLHDYERRVKFTYMVISLCGNDLMYLRSISPDGLGESTIVRCGIQMLFALKQIHEIGYVHRDVKPGNTMNGHYGREKRFLFVIDYGMVRSFVVQSGKKLSLRPPRKWISMRGTYRYCSINAHHRQELGRVDDLWSMLYALGELYVGLPWNKLKTEVEVYKMKSNTKEDDLFKECPAEFSKIAKYLKSLSYGDRPDYYFIYELFATIMKRENYSFLDPYDWEVVPEEALTPLQPTAEEIQTKKPATKANIEIRMFPHVAPERFREQILSI